ncbi:hypothetical protein B0T16DRAFT_399269 [Cercophora newfieldiana]|uniref:Uncharacterized protein n=1 Tax=Cercophora newfieldiana TaxID=92897 RepID=A0AA39YS39_9PEZI|nr:hypothetical protein B0T16DRAFT_399269 [Cercophora newfieldiana]
MRRREPGLERSYFLVSGKGQTQRVTLESDDILLYRGRVGQSLCRWFTLISGPGGLAGASGRATISHRCSGIWGFIFAMRCQLG